MELVDTCMAMNDDKAVDRENYDGNHQVLEDERMSMDEDVAMDEDESMDVDETMDGANLILYFVY